MAQPLPTTLAAVLLAFRLRLAGKMGLPLEQVRLVDPDDIGDQHPVGDFYLCVWWDGESPDKGIYYGAGRLDCRETVAISVTLLTRQGVDEAGSALLWATDPELGHLPTRHRILDAMLGEFLSDDGTADGNLLTVCPMEPAQLSRAKRERKDKSWGESRVGFQVTYILDLSGVSR